MLVFYEGIPGAGKSYGALVDHVIPAVKKGRRVYARLDGLNEDDYLRNIGKVCDVPFDVVADLIVHLSPDDVLSKVGFMDMSNALLLIDEIKKYYPSSRNSLNKNVVDLIGEHRKRGMDIIAIDQSMTDVHQVFRRRVDQLVKYTKLDYFGFSSFYRWVMLRGVPSDKGDSKFVRVSSGFGKYDKKYFSCYRSFVPGVDDYQQYGDSRGNVFKSLGFRGIFIFSFILLFLGYFFLSRFFDPDSNSLVKKHVDNKPIVKVDPPKSVSQPQPQPQPIVKAPVKTPEEIAREQYQAEQERKRKDFERRRDNEYIHKTALSCRLKFSAFIKYSDGRFKVLVDFVDPSYRVKERLSAEQLDSLGWDFRLLSDGVAVIHSREFGDDLPVTSFPTTDTLGRVSDSQSRDISAASRASSSSLSSPFHSSSSSSSAVVVSPPSSATPLPLPVISIRH